jgi:pimeloyl-ACP methyl ester carboxylesterase
MMAYQETFVQRDQHRIYVRDQPGAEPAIILMHGFSDNVLLYDGPYPYLSRLNEDLLPMARSRTQMIPKLKQFRRPVRIIFGDADPSLNSGVARTFHKFLPGSKLFLIPGARHFVQLDEPEQVARLILLCRAGEYADLMLVTTSATKPGGR